MELNMIMFLVNKRSKSTRIIYIDEAYMSALVYRTIAVYSL
jgi:hypothetical protein